MIIFSISLLLLNVNVLIETFAFLKKKKNKKIYRTFKKLKS